MSAGVGFDDDNMVEEAEDLAQHNHTEEWRGLDQLVAVDRVEVDSRDFPYSFEV